MFARRDPQPFRPSSPYLMREEYPTREIDAWLRQGEIREMSSRGMLSWRVTASEGRGKNAMLTLECGHTKLVGAARSKERWAFCHQCPGK